MPEQNPVIKVSAVQARRFLLDHQFLLSPRSIPETEIVSRLFPRLGCIQFDTINVVGRNADLVLQARVDNYRPETLEKLLYTDRTLVDGWDKMAAIFRTEDWLYFEYHRERMHAYHRSHSREAAKVIPKVRETLAADGPLSSLEFKSETKTNWFWGPTSVARAALEIMFAQGSIGIHHRINTRRYFDLVERLIPPEIISAANPNSTHSDYLRWHLKRRIGSMGLAETSAGEYWYGVSDGNKAAQRTPVLKNLHKSGKITQVEIFEMPKKTLYIRTEDRHRLESTQSGDLPDRRVSFIAPLDNLIWNRGLISDLFGFAYTWEVYKPKDQREYGYYVLPVLYGDQFIARANMKFEKKTSELNLLGWWWENWVKPDDEIISAAGEALREFRQFTGAQTLSFQPEQKFPKKDTTLIARILEQAA